MKRFFTISALAGATALLASCYSGNTPATNETTDTAATATPAQPVGLQQVTGSPEFPGAALSIKSVSQVAVGSDSTKITFNFEVKNYELKAQTTDNSGKGCNNSDKGQHIHFIMDNQPYKALYEPKNEVTVANGTEHYLLCFLSRSYHEALKNKEAAALFHFKVAEKGGSIQKMDQPKEAMLFYSRPKGDYFGKDTTNVLLDFYVWNGTLAADGMKVKAEIANNDKPAQQLTATLDKWTPNFITNLGTGKSKVTLTLVDKDGKTVAGPQSTVSREFNMAVAETLK